MMKGQRKLLLVLTAAMLTACAPAEKEGQPVETPQAESQTEKETESTQAETQESSMASDHEFTAGDIYVIGNPILSDGSFLKVNMADIKNIEENLRHHSGEERIDGGYYIYEMGEAMSYVTRSTMDGRLCAVILTTDQFRLGCGLKVGMNEAEISSLGLPFVQYSKEDYPTDSEFAEDISCPFNTLDYDTIYLYQSDGIPKDAADGDTAVTKGRIGITALVKDGEVINVFVELF